MGINQVATEGKGSMRWLSTIFTTQQMKEVLLVGQSIVYLIAFASLYWQIPGLYSDRGITPISPQLECDSESIFDCKSLLLQVMRRFVPSMSPSSHLSLLCLISMALSLLTVAFRKTRNFLVYAFLWISYVAAYEVGGTFLWFQWDILLLETGVLATILASFHDGPADQISIYLYRWLACRLMFASGIVKLQSGCPTWWNLTALDVHYESQCLPTPIAWYFHHFPQWFNRLSVALTFYIELYLPPMFLLPFESIRWFAAIPQIKFMLLIMLTGNYNFFNVLYSLVCLSMLEVGYDNSPREKRQNFFFWVLETVLFMGIAGFSLWHFSTWFGVQIDWKRMIVESEIVFSRFEFDQAVEKATRYIIYAGIGGLTWKALITLYRTKGEFWNIIHYVFVLSLGGFIFAISLVPFTYLDGNVGKILPKPVRELHEITRKYHLVSSYGLFRSMTGIEGRPEVIIEGSANPDGPWKEIEFYAKPGNLNRMPQFVVPHQPRLDWQMWFAALGTYQQNPWFVSMVYHLLNNNTNVVRLVEKYPFTKEEPMKFARAQLYHYRYAKKGEIGWWTREKQAEYMPTLSRNAQPILEYLAKQKLIVKPTTFPKTTLSTYLGKIQRSAFRVDQTLFVWSVLAIVPVIWVTKWLFGF
ncbi:unnamed protein product, partial [Mesorhabditis belari]|uniref:Lipase maturation factor n=1 Tax=Mesorhabditis belari TaxID=2138241 RepID=A0AAF3ENS0_9BILA